MCIYICAHADCNLQVLTPNATLRQAYATLNRSAPPSDDPCFCLQVETSDFIKGVSSWNSIQAATQRVYCRGLNNYRYFWGALCYNYSIICPKPHSNY